MRENTVSYSYAEIKANAFNKEPLPDPAASGYVFHFLSNEFPPQRDLYESAVDAYASEFRLSENDVVPATVVVHYMQEYDQSYVKTH